MARENMTAIARPRPERGQPRPRSQLLLPAFALVLDVAGTTAGAGAVGAHVAYGIRPRPPAAGLGLQATGPLSSRPRCRL